MIHSANDYPISQIFSIDTKAKYVIPKYQREYIWGKEQWENLFNDLDENDPGHFLGSIICINRGKDALDVTPLEIIDGQQRLTTISLIYAAIYDALLEENRSDDDFVTEKNNLKNRLIQKGGNNEFKLELSYQNNNYADYRAILNNIGLHSDSDTPPNLGNRRIHKAYSHYKNKLSALDYEKVLGFLIKVNSALLVKIEVGGHADAFILFESLNNRGIPLSALDLIKNKILAELEKKKILEIDKAFVHWKKLIDNVSDYSVQERFLRQYYNAFKYRDSIKQAGVQRATKSNLIKIYENLIEQDVGFIFKELIEKAEIYRLFTDPGENGDNDEPYYKGLTDLLHIGGAPAYMFLLYLFSEHKNKHELIKGSINFLVKYFVRRNLTDFPGTRDLDMIFMKLIDECESNKGQLTSSFVTDYFVGPEKMSDIGTFAAKLGGNIYEDNAAVTRFILCRIEEEHQTKEIFRDFWERDKNKKYMWTIEHIFPEGKNIPKEWIDMIAGGNEQKAKKLQDEFVHKLGNLTMTAYNASLSNFSYQKKRDRMDKKGNCIGYKNGLHLNEDLACKDSWTVDDINDRTDKLVRQALEHFKINDEKIAYVA